MTAEVDTVKKRFTARGLFNEGYCPVARDGSCGFIDENGNAGAPLVFEGATHVYEGRARAKQNGLWGQIEITAIIAF